MDFSTYAQWSGYLTVAFLALTILAFIFRWAIRFRFVGITGFMVVLTVGLFGLGLGLFAHTDIPGAVRFTRVYDNGGNEMVISVTPSITKSEVEATLKQAASNYFSSGRTGSELTIRLRTLLHPKPGLSQPIYLGQVKRSLAVQNDEKIQVEIFSKNLAQLPKIPKKKEQG